jgi:uncharacterized membrane protein YfbV (UPF0208 family)
MDGVWYEILRSVLTAAFRIFLLSSGVQVWWIGSRAASPIRVGLIIIALFMIEGSNLSDILGAVALHLVSEAMRSKKPDVPDVR